MPLSVFEIPLSPNAQRFDITLLDVDYNLLLIWNPISGNWVLDISDSNNVPLVTGIPLITGADLLAQYRYLGFGGGMIVTVDEGIGVPTFAGLGATGHLYFVVPTDTVVGQVGANIYGIDEKKTTLPVSGGTA